MTLLVLSAQGKPNETIRLVDARNFGVTRGDGRTFRELSHDHVAEIANLLTKNWRVLPGDETPPEDLIEDVPCEDLLNLGGPLEIYAYQANKPIMWNLDPKEIRNATDDELIYLLSVTEELARELKNVQTLDKEIVFGIQHPTLPLQDVAELEMFSRRSDGAWPSSITFKPTDIVISLIRFADIRRNHVLTDNPEFTSTGPDSGGFSQVSSWKRICRIRVKEDSPVTSATIRMYLDTPTIQKRFQQVAQISNNSVIPPEVIRNLPIPCPPLDVQKKALSMWISADELQWSLLVLNEQIDEFYGSQNFQKLIAGIILGGKS
jgi:hypothetical protein